MECSCTHMDMYSGPGAMVSSLGVYFADCPRLACLWPRRVLTCSRPSGPLGPQPFSSYIEEGFCKVAIIQGHCQAVASIQRMQPRLNDSKYAAMTFSNMIEGLALPSRAFRIR
eukprot:1158689-Pelagomonas_calceolata.AAC.13